MNLSLAALQWNADPIFIQLGPIRIAWYGLFFACAFFVGNIIMTKVYKREGRDEEELEKLLLYMVVGTILGARLGHCFLYDPSYYLSNPIKILKIWEGGLASHGGAIGIISALFLFARGENRPTFLWVLDRITLPAALACFFIRCGNFMNSEIVGHPSDLPWAIEFQRRFNELGPGARHPTQLYEAFSYLIIFIILVLLYKKTKDLNSGLLAGIFLSLVFLARFFIEFVKKHQAAFIKEEATLSMGQYLSIPFFILGVFLIVKSFQKKSP